MDGTDAGPISGELQSILAEEEALLARAREAVSSVRGVGRTERSEGQALRSLQEEYAAAGEEDRPALLAQLHEARARVDRARSDKLPDPIAPYFGHLRLRSQGRARDVLLGAAPLVDTKRGVTIVEWRKAPIAEAFFACEPGDPYEIEVDGRVIEGKVERRHLVTVEEGELSRVTVEGGVLRKNKGGDWFFEPNEEAPRLLSPGERKVERRTLVTELDAEQKALVDRDPGAPLCVLGSAGSGKTTVALHRVAAICRRYPDEFPPSEVLVLVPEPGLRRLSERTLAALGIEGVRVSTFDDWIRSEARRVFPWLSTRESTDGPFAASRLKRHPALFSAMERLIEDEGQAMAKKIDRVLGLGQSFAEALAARKEGSLLHRLDASGKTVTEKLPAKKKRLFVNALSEARQKAGRMQGELGRLVGDRELLEMAIEASRGELLKGYVELVAEHTRRQLDTPSEKRFAHVDKDRLETLDGRSLDDGTPEALAGTVDVEDYAILFELLFRKTGGSSTEDGDLSRYKHIVLDEAQELSPIELRVIGRALAKGGSVTVAGDAAQRIDRTGYFESWEAVLSELGVVGESAFLETSYRSPRPIVELAHEVLGDEAPPQLPRIVREGAPIVRTNVPGEGHAAALLCASLRRHIAEDSGASVAVIARDEASARATHEALSRGVPARLVLDGDFSFGPGVEVTEIAAVKGLEFDDVVIPDASEMFYPDTPEARRAMHVAVSRAMRRVWIVSPGRRSPILLKINKGA